MSAFTRQEIDYWAKASGWAHWQRSDRAASPAGEEVMGNGKRDEQDHERDQRPPLAIRLLRAAEEARVERRAEHDHPDLPQIGGDEQGQNGRAQRNEDPGAVRRQRVGHAPHRLGDHDHGDDLQAVEPAQVAAGAQRLDREREGGQCDRGRKGEAEPGQEATGQAGRSIPIAMPSSLLAGPGSS
jgi:hypothetical protein